MRSHAIRPQRPLRLLSTPVLAMLLGGCAVAPVSSPPSTSEFPALEAAVEREPGNADRAVRLASGYRQAGRLADAAALLERTVSAAPAHAPSILLLGATYEDMGRYSEARALYTRDLGDEIPAELRRKIRQRAELLRRGELQAAVRAALQREAELANTAPPRNTVAVFPFVYTGDDPELRPLGRAIADMLSTDLAQTDRLRVLERLQVQMLVDEMALAESGMTDPETAARSGRLLGAERVVQGALDPRGGGRLALEAAVVDVLNPRDTAAARTVTEADALARLFDLEKRLAFQIYSSLGVQLTPAERARVDQRPTQDVQALLAYGMGLEAMDAGEYERAVEQFQRAAALDPGFSQAQQRSAQAQSAGRAARTSAGDLARQALAAATAEPAEAAELEAVVPGLGQRDAVAEVLRTEGLTRARTILEMIIRYP